MKPQTTLTLSPICVGLYTAKCFEEDQIGYGKVESNLTSPTIDHKDIRFEPINNLFEDDPGDIPQKRP